MGGRTLLSAAVDLDFGLCCKALQFKSNFKSGGRECPPQTEIYKFKLFRYCRRGPPRSGRLRANSTVAFRNPNLSPVS